ncbi:MAG: hypothetical protein ACTH31_16235, partial [Pseudoclavibacter sp.]
ADDDLDEVDLDRIDAEHDAFHVFRPASSEQRHDSTAFDDAAAVHGELLDMLATELVVSEARLTRIVGRRFGLSRVTADRVTRMLSLLPEECRRRESDGGAFAWAPGVDPASLVRHRTQETKDRVIEEISRVELANALRLAADAQKVRFAPARVPTSGGESIGEGDVDSLDVADAAGAVGVGAADAGSNTGAASADGARHRGGDGSTANADDRQRVLVEASRLVGFRRIGNKIQARLDSVLAELETRGEPTTDREPAPDRGSTAE